METNIALQQALDMGPVGFTSLVNKRVERPWDYLDHEELVGISTDPRACSARSVLARSIEDALSPAPQLSQAERENAWAWLLRPVYSPKPSPLREMDEGLTVEAAVEATALPLWQLLEGLILAGKQEIEKLFGGKAQERLLAEVRSYAHQSIN
jgi:hypothetical protein